MMILDQFGRPYEVQKKPEREALPAAPILTSQRAYVASGLTPQRLAAIFREADQGEMLRQVELFEAIEEKDAHIIGETGKRRNAINEVTFSLGPASEDARDVKVAEFVSEVIDGITDFYDIFVGLQDAVGKGYAAFEINWDVSSGQAVPLALEWLDQKRFRFTAPDGSLRKDPLLISDANPQGDEIPAWRTIFHRYGGKCGNATRSGIYRVCAWMYLFKNYSIKDWSVFCELYGMPLRIGKYDAGASPADKAALRAAIQSIGSDAAGIISKNTEIEFVESLKGSTASDLWEKFISFCNREISKAVLGMAQSSDSQSPGSFAADKVKDMVRQDLLKSDCRAAARTARHQFIRPLVGFNFGWDTPLPTYEPDFEEHEDLDKKSAWLDKIVRMGVPVPVSFAQREFGIPDPEKDEAIIIVPGGGLNAPITAKLSSLPHGRTIRVHASDPGASDGQDEIDAYPDQLDDVVAEILAGMIDGVKDLVTHAASLEEIRDGLIDLYPAASAAEFGAIMQRALTAASLLGSVEVGGA